MNPDSSKYCTIKSVTANGKTSSPSTRHHASCPPNWAKTSICRWRLVESRSKGDHGTGWNWCSLQLLLLLKNFTRNPFTIQFTSHFSRCPLDGPSKQCRDPETSSKSRNQYTPATHYKGKKALCLGVREICGLKGNVHVTRVSNCPTWPSAYKKTIRLLGINGALQDLRSSCMSENVWNTVGGHSKHMCMYLCVYIIYIYILYIYMCVCVRVCVYLCIYISMYISLCSYVSMFLCIYISIYQCIYESMYLCMYVSMYVSMYLCMYVSLYVCMYVCMSLSMFLCIYVSMFICEDVYM